MTLRVVHISDTHLSAEHPGRSADLENCVRQINEASPRADIVIHTGDIADHGLADQYHIARSLLEELAVPYYLMPGNRDSRQQMLSVFADKHFVPPGTQFIQYAIEDFDTRIVVIDTLCEGSNKGQLCDTRLTHLEQMLALDTSRNVAVFMHHPPFQSQVIPDPVQFTHWSQVDQFRAVLARYENVCGLYCGHLHRSIDSQVDALPVRAISCMAGDLRWDARDDEDRARPVFRTLVLD